MSQDLATTSYSAHGLNVLSGPQKPPVQFGDNLESIVSQAAHSPEAATIRTFALMRRQILTDRVVQDVLESHGAFPNSSVHFANSYHNGFSRVVFPICNFTADGKSTNQFALKLGSSHFCEFAVSNDEIAAEKLLSDRLAALPEFAPHFAQNFYGALIPIPLPILEQVHFGMADWVRNNDLPLDQQPAIAFQICEWIDGPTLDYAMTQRLLSPNQARALGEKIIGIIVETWHATFQNGQGVIYDTDVNDIILAQAAQSTVELSIDRPVFIDADGGKKSGGVGRLCAAIDLFIEMYGANRADKAACAIKAIEIARAKFDHADYQKFQPHMLAYLNR